jgi:hypothetical protein
MAKEKALVSYTAKEILKKLDEHNNKIDCLVEKMDNRIIIVEQKIPFHEKLIIGAYCLGMTTLGFLVSHFLGA